jgi:hypothetical protein
MNYLMLPRYVRMAIEEAPTSKFTRRALSSYFGIMPPLFESTGMLLSWIAEQQDPNKAPIPSPFVASVRNQNEPTVLIRFEGRHTETGRVFYSRRTDYTAEANIPVEIVRGGDEAIRLYIWDNLYFWDPDNRFEIEHAIPNTDYSEYEADEGDFTIDLLNATDTAGLTI